MTSNLPTRTTDDVPIGWWSGSWSRLDARFVRMRWLEVGCVALAAAAIAGGFGSTVSTGLAGILAGIVIVISCLALLWVSRRVRSWGYDERAEDLLVRRGVLVRRMSVIPYGRMQFIDVTAGPIERAFHLSTVKMHTAASTSDARIPGLDREIAAQLRDRLARLGESRLAGL